jgi:MoxR-like ATPase
MDALNFTTYVDAAKLNSGYSIGLFKQVAYPYKDIITKQIFNTAAYVVQVVIVDIDGLSTEEHTVVVAYRPNIRGGPDYTVWCADLFLEGRIDLNEAVQRATEASQNATGTGDLYEKLLNGYNICDPSDSCDFWTKWRKDKKLCSHTAHALAYLREINPNFTDDLKAAYSDSLGASSVPTNASDTYTLPEMAFKVPVLIEGDRGSGKTFEARAFARSSDYAYVEANGHEGVEAPDLLGFLVPVAKGELIWKDGPLARAFRLAQTQKTVLVIDEMLRIRQRELSILLTAFSPDNGFYRLPTGRILRVVDGVGEEEVLEAPVGNLAVIATTNVYGSLDAIDPALAERFMPIRKDTEVEALRAILVSIAESKSFSVDLAEKCVQFFLKMTEAKTQGLVLEIPTTRTLSRALQLARNPGEVQKGIRSQILLWVGRDLSGHPVEEQVSDCTKLLERVFKGK